MTKHYNKRSELEKRRKLRREQTYYEKLVWIYLRNHQMFGYKFKQQYSIDHYVLAFYCPKLKLAVEIDGEVHEQPDQKKYDEERQKYIENFGIAFVRVTNRELFGNPEKAFEKIENAIKSLKPS